MTFLALASSSARAQGQLRAKNVVRALAMKRALLIGVGLLFGHTPALAQGLAQSDEGSSLQAGFDPDAPPPSVHVVDDVEPKRPLVPPAKDLLGAHILVGAGVSPTWSLGKLSSDVAASEGLGTGVAAHLDAGIGLSRFIAVGVFGTFAGYTSGDSCGSSCRGQALSVGPFVRYHLLQGLRFDPWLSLGGGYRQLSFKTEGGARQRFTGVEWLRLELGADYYAFSGFAFGPYGALGLSSFSNRPNDAGSASVSTELSVGLRLLLDLPGR
jgi:hypothetical protein